MSALRLIAAYLLAPGAPALLLYLLQRATGISHAEASMVGVIVAAASYGAAALLGIPLGIVFSVLRVRSPLAYLAAGCALGGMTAAAVVAQHLWLAGFNVDATQVWGKLSAAGVLGLPTGAVGGLSFWLLAVWRSKAFQATKVSSNATLPSAAR